MVLLKVSEIITPVVTPIAARNTAVVTAPSPDRSEKHAGHEKGRSTSQPRARSRSPPRVQR